MNYIGIDPGKNGAIAAIDASGAMVFVVDMPDNVRDLWDVLLPESLTEARVVAERQQSMPKQGVASSFQTGKGYGEILGVLAASGMAHEVVGAPVWKKAMGLTADKQKSRDMARRLWPTAPLARVKDEGRCEALLLAEYLRRRECGTVSALEGERE